MQVKTLLKASIPISETHFYLKLMKDLHELTSFYKK